MADDCGRPHFGSVKVHPVLRGADAATSGRQHVATQQSLVFPLNAVWSSNVPKLLSHKIQILC